jgi:NADPH:quinone reductase-like Zn-dependent oxidoreductase
MIMKANRIHRHGPPDVIVFEEIAQAVPGIGEVLVRVKAAGVGPWDSWIRQGHSAIAQALPLTLGSDLSGIVESVGRDVAGFAPGDEVYGVTNARFIGAYAQFAITEAGMIARKPRALGFVEAASVPVIAVTAWQMLCDHAGIAPGQTVLVLGAAGNVGAFSVQLAHLLGARVIAAASPGDSPMLRSLGADEVVDIREVPFERLARSVDVVIDAVGADIQSQSFAVIKPGGVLVSAVSQPDKNLARQQDVRTVFFIVDVTTRRLTQIAERLDARELRTRVGAILPLGDARQAHEMLDGLRPKPQGKIVLQADE